MVAGLLVNLNSTQRPFFILVFTGETLGKVKKGAVIRSHDDEKETFALVCPCNVSYNLNNMACFKLTFYRCRSGKCARGTLGKMTTLSAS